MKTLLFFLGVVLGCLLYGLFIEKPQDLPLVECIEVNDQYGTITNLAVSRISSGNEIKDVAHPLTGAPWKITVHYFYNDKPVIYMAHRMETRP